MDLMITPRLRAKRLHLAYYAALNDEKSSKD
jgi:hypothetical protein